MLIRLEDPKDFIGIHTVNVAAFETPAEANLVEVLRREVDVIISLVAEQDGEIVGHILFSPVALSGHEQLKIMGLGPMAVMPAQQRKGTGSMLVKVGLEMCREFGYGAVVVLGHIRYYPRFGFIPAVRYGIRCEYDVPAEVFMVVELQPGYLNGAKGILRYHQAFDEV